MKKVITCICICFCFGFAYNQQTIDTTFQKEITEQLKKLNEQFDKTDTLILSLDARITKIEPPKKVEKDFELHDFWTWILIYLPMILSLVFTLYIINRLKVHGFNIAQALAEEEPIEMTIEDPANKGTYITKTYTIKDKNENEIPVMKKSTSRLVLLLTSVVALSISISVTCDFTYFMLTGCTSPDYDSLWQILAALGIGIIPYGINKFTKPTTTTP